MTIVLQPKDIFIKLLCLIVALLIFNISGIVAQYFLNIDPDRSLILLFDFNTENSIPTLYSSLAMLFASILLTIVAATHKNNGSAYFSWLLLAILFLFLSIDEFTSIHERLNAPVRNILHTSGLLFFAWVIPYGAILIVFLAAYLKFLLRLPKNIMILFVGSGVMFVTGAIGVELLGGRYMELYGKYHLVYSILYTCEEFLEMLGIALFIYALLTYIADEFGTLTISANRPD